MGHELINSDNASAISILNQNNLGDILKPMIREIHLFDSYVAGTTHLKDASVLKEINVGDSLTLQREDNRYDKNAILLMTAEKKKLGYVPEKDNIIFARLMDAGKILKAKITDIKPKDNYFTLINIGIYLVDL